MKYLITGASGYIGSRTLRRLINDHEVTVVLRRPVEECEHIADLAGHPNLTYVQTTGAYEELVKAVEHVDHVIHLAALYTNASDEQSVLNLLESNIVFSTHLLLALKTHNPNATFVTANTFSAYDNNGNYAPKTIYSATKVAVEDLAQAFIPKSAVVRLSDTYGPGDWRIKIHNLLNNAFKKGERFDGRSPGTQVINLTHVDDVITAFINLGESMREDDNAQPAVYDLFYPENNITLEEIGNILAKPVKGKFSFPEVGKIDALPPQRFVIDSRIFTPQYSVREEIFSTLN